MKRQLGFECSEVPFLQVVNFRSGGKSDIKKKRGKEENVFKEYLFLFLFFSFFYGQAVKLAER